MSTPGMNRGGYQTGPPIPSGLPGQLQGPPLSLGGAGPPTGQQVPPSSGPPQGPPGCQPPSQQPQQFPQQGMGPPPSGVMGPAQPGNMLPGNIPPSGPPGGMGPGPPMGPTGGPPSGMGLGGPIGAPQSPMRPPDRSMPPQMQHGPPPPPQVRTYGAPPMAGYQNPNQRSGYGPGGVGGLQGTPPPGGPPQGMHPSRGVNQSMPPPPNPYPGRMTPQGPMGMDSRKRPPDGRPSGPPPKGMSMGSGPPGLSVPPSVPSSGLGGVGGGGGGSSKKKKKLAEKILPQKVRDLVPESQAYMDLLAFERKLDFTIMRKRLDIQEALKRPMKQKRKLRIFISNTFYPGKPEGEGTEEPTVPSWELRVEGRLLDDPNAPKADQSKGKRKFSSFFKSLVIELDKDLYGPDNHLVESSLVYSEDLATGLSSQTATEFTKARDSGASSYSSKKIMPLHWHRTPTTTETDGFQVKRPGDKNVRCTILLLLDYQPLQFKLDSRLARLLGIHTQSRPMIISALWQYIKTHRLQDAHEREYVNCDKYLEQIFQCPRMKFAEIPQRLHALLHPPDPIVINHIISVEGPDTKKTACYDIDVEVDDPLKIQMNNFLLCTSSQQEIQSLDNKIHETVETINQLKTNREFFLSFAKDPQQFIDKWLISQSRDLKIITDVVGNPEEERRCDFFYQPWGQEAVCRYFYGKVQQRRAELEQALGIRNT